MQGSCKDIFLEFFEGYIFGEKSEQGGEGVKLRIAEMLKIASPEQISCNSTLPRKKVLQRIQHSEPKMPKFQKNVRKSGYLSV